MFPRKLTGASHDQSLKLSADYKHEFEISDTGYGKDHVKILHVRRDNNVHYIKEFEVNTHLKLYSKKDYLNGKSFLLDSFTHFHDLIIPISISISTLIFIWLVFSACANFSNRNITNDNYANVPSLE